MSVFYNNALIGASGQATSAYQIERSIRLNSADSAYLSRTPASAGNRKTWTWSGWVKKTSNGGDYRSFFTAFNSTSVYTALDFSDTDNLRLTALGGGSMTLVTSAVYRDPSAWYHIVFAVDTTQATASNRAKLYVNGTQITTFSTASYPSQNSDTEVSNTVNHQIGRNPYAGFPQPLNAFLADVFLIDGQALTPSSFGVFDANNVWQPKAYTGSYGTNGFQLKFADNSAATATTLGKDTSGNGNNWTPNNLSVTAGAGNDSLVDSPTNYGTDTGAGGTVRGNYCTLNPLGLGGGTLSNGNLTVSTSTDMASVGTFAMTTGKWYWEVTLTTAANPRIGVYNIGAASPAGLGGTANGWAIINAPSRVFHNGATTSYGSFSGASGNIVMIAYDADLGRIWYGENGTWFASGNPATNSNPSQTSVTGTAIVPASSSGLGSNVHDCNFGQRSFSYQAPSGFKALCTQNLPVGSITTSGSFTGNANANGPFIWLNGVPTAMTINGNSVTFGTHADKLSNGFKVRTNSTSYNTSGNNTYSITTTGDKFKNARAQTNP